MVEVCFNDSVKATLAYAQHCGSIQSASSVGIITDEKGIRVSVNKQKMIKQYKERQDKLQKNAVSLGGNREDIVGVSFDLSEGDIKSPIIMGECFRKSYIHSKFSFNRYDEPMDIEDHINEFWSNCISDLEKLKSNPLQIRVWIDHTPDARCGLAFLADLLKDSQTEIHIVELPKKIVREDNMIAEYRGWIDVEPELYSSFLNYQKMLTEKEIHDLASKWKQLKTENAPLRVVENDLIVSADVDYYDGLIRKEFPEGACKVAYIIGNALRKQKIPTGDVFIAKRIQEFVQQGELEIVGDVDGGLYSNDVKCTR